MSQNRKEFPFNAAIQRDPAPDCALIFESGGGDNITRNADQWRDE